MTDIETRLENLLALSERLSAAIETDITALETGDFAGLATADPEIDKLSLIYAREVTAIRNSGVKGAPQKLIQSLRDAGVKFKALLKRHARLVGAMRGASEGLVRAVAEEVERMRVEAMPYTPTPQPKRATGNAIVYNRVV